MLKYNVGVSPDGSICIIKTKGGSFQYSADELKKEIKIPEQHMQYSTKYYLC